MSSEFVWLRPEAREDLPCRDDLYDEVVKKNGNAVRVWRWHHQELLYAEIYEDELGLPHRNEAEGPAENYYDINGRLFDTVYMKHGLQHRTDGGPSRNYTCPYGSRDTLREWKMNGMRHREGGKPAYISKDPEEESLELMYMVHDKMHREGDKPAYIYMDGDGFKEVAYCIHGLYHRTTGPARMIIDLTTKQETRPEYYILNRKQLGSFADMVPELNSPS